MPNRFFSTLMLAAVFCVSAARPVPAVPVDYSVYPHLDHTEYLDGQSNAVKSYSLWGRDFFAVANENSSLHLYEVVGGEVLPRGIAHTTGRDKDVVVRDWFVFVATESGLTAVNVAVPEAPYQAGFLNLPGDPVQIAVSATHAFVACGAGGLQVVDITDPVNMSVVGGHDAQAISVWYDNGRLGLVTGQNLEILDVSLPTVPVSLGSFNLGNYNYNCVIQGDIAYASTFFQVRQLDISDPAAITSLRVLPIGSNQIAHRLDSQGDELVFAGSYNLHFVDFATGDIKRTSEQVGNVRDAALIAGKIMAVGDNRIEFHDDGLHAHPAAGNFLAAGLLEPRGFMFGNYLYGTSLTSDRTLVATELGGGGGLAWSLELGVIGYATRGTALRDWTLAAVSADGKLSIINVAVNGAVLRGTLNFLDGFYTPYNQDRTVDFLDDDTLVVLDEKYPGPPGNRNIRVVDISNPDNPVQIGQYYMILEYPEHIMVAGSTVVASSWSGYEIIDARDPTALAHLAVHPNPETAHHRIYARDSWLYAVLDAPTSPIGEVGPQRLETYDLSDPENPVLVHSLNLASAENLSFAGDYAYQNNSGLILDFSDPSAPTPVGNFYPPNPEQLFSSPQVLAGTEFIITGNLFDGLDSSGEYLVAQGATGEISAVGPGLPPVPRDFGLQAVPNPFNPRVSIRFELPAEDITQFKIYDLRGRKVADLGSRVRAAGPHEVVWEGTDLQGRSLPSGVYLARVATSAGAASLKIVLAR